MNSIIKMWIVAKVTSSKRSKIRARSIHSCWSFPSPSFVLNFFDIASIATNISFSGAGDSFLTWVPSICVIFTDWSSVLWAGFVKSPSPKLPLLGQTSFLRDLPAHVIVRHTSVHPFKPAWNFPQRIAVITVYHHHLKNYADSTDTHDRGKIYGWKLKRCKCFI